TQVLGLILEKATGKSPAEYLHEKLWEPMGMQFDAGWSLDSKKHQTEKMFCCLNARAVDLAKLGSLYANKGKWLGTQLVPENWIFNTANTYGNYSNHWWHTRNTYPVADSSKLEKPYRVIKSKDGGQRLQKMSVDLFAQGLLGQYLYVYPEKKIVILRISKREGYGVPWPYLFREIAGMN
ncbi:MAG: serine hydrolase, partial [Bacteroidia bacterium]|nr:serine hydrolase [Bacteroidia bacterium]